MPFNIPGVPSQLDARSMGNFDLGAALKQGFGNYQGFEEAKNTPKRLSEALLAAQLNNKINTAKAKYAEQNEAANLANTQAGTQNLNDTHGMSGLQRQILQMKINQAQSEADMDKRFANGGQPSTMGNNPTVSGIQNQAQDNETPAPTLKDNLTDGMGNRTNQNVVSAGNKDNYWLDDAVDSSPAFAARAKKKYGVEKKVTSKYDPKTGITSIITEWPSKKITVETSGIKSQNGKSPLTTKTLSSLQSAKVAIPQLRKVIDQLIDAPSPVHPKLPYGIGDVWRPGARKQHEDLVRLGKDLFAKAKGLTTTEKALETGMETLERGNFQSDETYHQALLATKKLLDEDEEQINSAINTGVSTDQQSGSKKNDPLGIR